MFDWRWDFTWDILPRLIAATGNTLLAAGLGYAIAVVLGLVLALAQRTPSRALTLVVREAIEFIRSTPLVLQIFFVFYVGPQFGLRLSPWTAGMIAIGLHYAAYLSEVYRGGLDSVPKGQWEAATSLNLSTSRTYFRVILPQALPPSLAGMGNYLVGIFKDTPMLSVIGVAELMHTANAIGSETYRFLEPYTLVGIIFLALSLPTAAGIRVFEAWVRRKLGMV
jgi:polar amino acid transport system permease protein